MNTKTAGYFVIAGVFLILIGVMGYVTHPERALTSLIFGGGFGVLWMLWGILSAKGRQWTWLAAAATTGLIGLTCAWRGSLGWLAVAGGESEKAFASVLITLMLVVSALMAFFLLKDRRHADTDHLVEGAV